jgi:hypothetical protein
MRIALLVASLSTAFVGMAACAAPAAASPASASSPCHAAAPASPTLRADLKSERERIARTDADLKSRNEAMKLRGATLDLQDAASVDAYNRDLAALEADVTANDRAWDAYRARVAQADDARRAAARCGMLAIGARASASAPAATSGPAKAPASAGR